MLYNRFAQHVVNDKKKMYKRGSQWVVASAFALAIGGFGVTQTQTVRAAETQPQLTVQSVKEVHKTDATTPSSAASSQAAQAQTATVATAQTAAPAQQKAASTTPVQVAQPASAAAKAATVAVQTNAPAPSSASMTDEQWKAAKAKYDQAKADAAKQEAAAKSQAEAAKSAYPDQIDKQLNAQKDKDTSDYYQYQKDGWSDLMTFQKSQAASYAAASQAATKEISDLNAERVTPNIQVGDGGTFNFVARTGAWNNIITAADSKNKTWNGNYLVQHLPEFTDKEVLATVSLSSHSDDWFFPGGDSVHVPKWALTDVVKNGQLSQAQRLEVNQYAMMLVNNYRSFLGLSPLKSTEEFLSLVQKRSDSLTGMTHDPDILNKIFGGSWAEALSGVIPTEKVDGKTTMLGVLDGVASAIDGLFNEDGSSDTYEGDHNWGHRKILLSESYDTTSGGWALKYFPGEGNSDGGWLLNFDTSGDLDGKNIATVPEKDSSLPVDNNYEIDVKVEQVQSKINNLKNQQQKDYQAAYDSYSDKLSSIAEKINADYDAIRQIPQKIQTFNDQQDASVQALTKRLDAEVAQLDPGPEPNTPTSGGSSASSSASSSAASSANSSSASSAASSATSSSASSAASSASSSAASSANSSSASSAASSATSSSASSAASSASSSAASSANSSGASTAASSATSSSASLATSSASSSAASSANSSAASSAASSASSSATSSAASSAASSASSSTSSSAASGADSSTAPTPDGLVTPKNTNTTGSGAASKPAVVTPLVKMAPSSTQPLSRMTQKYGKHAYPATGESQSDVVLAEAGALIIAVLGFAGVRRYRHAK